MKSKMAMVAVAFLVLGCQETSNKSSGPVVKYDPQYGTLTEPTAKDLLPANTDTTEEGKAYAGRANATCVSEKNVSFKPKKETKLNTAQITALLSGNTILSADQDGVFAIYYRSAKQTVGWMPKKTSLNIPDWNVGKVSFDNDQYCRTWAYWNGGVETCWEIHKGPDRIDRPSFYFICGNGGVAGDQHVVLPGNALGVEYKGEGNKSGTLTQAEDKAAYFVEKYFGNYINK